MITFKGLGSFLVVCYDIDKAGATDLSNQQPTAFTEFKDIVLLHPTNISISFRRERIIQNASISLPYIEEFLDPSYIFKIVEVWFYDENGNGTCLFRGLVKNIQVSERAGDKTIDWELEDVLAWLEYYTTIYYKGKMETDIVNFLVNLIERVKLFYNLRMAVDARQLFSIFYGRTPLVTLDKTNVIDNLQKYINQTAHKIFYNPKTNAIEISSVVYAVMLPGKVYVLDESNVTHVSYDVFSNYYVGVRINTIKVGYSFQSEKLDEYANIVVYDPFVVERTDFKPGELENRLLDIWIEPQNGTEDMVNIAKERLLQIIGNQKVDVEIIPTKEAFEMWLGDWVEFRGVNYFIDEIRYNISPNNISVNLLLKKFLSFDLGQDIKANVKFWTKNYVDTYWDGKTNSFTTFD